MKRRDFNRLVVGAGVSPIFAKSSLAQMSAEELQTTPSKAVAPSIIIKNSPRTYNQVNVPRTLSSYPVWRSGAPLVLAPDKDDPSLADDPQRNNNFNYAKMDPQGYAVT
jgi:hypothetical protein